MIALKPVLQAWLEEAEAQAKNKRRDPEAPSVLPMGEVDDVRTAAVSSQGYKATRGKGGKEGEQEEEEEEEE